MSKSLFGQMVKLVNKIGFYSNIRPFVNRIIGKEDVAWSRVIMNQETTKLIESLNPPNLDVLEISGEFGKRFNFKSYKVVGYPEFDICEEKLEEQFDLIIAEQVFEHLLWPYRAGKNVHAMLRPNGNFMISTPFLIKIHNYPIDCSRWSEIGLKHLLAECGFPIDSIQTGSWGNKACVKANLDYQGRAFSRRLHSLKNEIEYPFHVWALAKIKGHQN